MIGGDLSIQETNFQNHSQEEAKLFDDINTSDRISMFTAVVLMVNASISTDVFYFGYFFKCGIIQSVLIGLGVMMIAIFTFKVYMQTCTFGSTNSYPSIWTKCFGQKTAFFANILIFLAFSINTIVCTKDYFSDVFEIVSLFYPNSIFTKYRWALMFFVVIIVFFPVLFLEKASGLYMLAYVAKFGLLMGILGVVFVFIEKVQKEGIDENHQMVLWSTNMDFFFEAFSGFNVVMFLHPVVHFIVRDLVKPTKNRIMKCLWITESVTLISCLTTGFAAYFIFFNNNEGQNVLKYFNPNKTITIIAKIGSTLSNTGLNCFYIWILAQEISNILIDGCSKSLLVRIFSGLVVILFNIAASFLNQTVIDFLFLLGYLAFVFLSFFLPSIFFLKIYGFVNFKWGMYSIIMLIVSLIIIIADINHQLSLMN